MSLFLTHLESFVRRRGVVMPRLYLLVVLAVLGGLLGFLCVPYCRKFLATVILHDWFVVCATAIGGPLFLCDPSRARNSFWTAFHLACLSGATVLASFFLCFCDLAYRDDRAFLTLLSCFVTVILGRAYVADLVITFFARSLAASSSGRANLLSIYARMLGVDPGIAKLRPPVLGARLILSIRERCQRILGLRRTRSRAIEDEIRRSVDRQALETDCRPSDENIGFYFSTMGHEIALDRILVSPGVDSREVAERWPGNFINRWAVLTRALQRFSCRRRGTVGDEESNELHADLSAELLEEARSVMLVAHRGEPGGDKEMLAAIALFQPKARISTRDLRLEFDRHVLGFRRASAIPKKTQYAFMLVALAAAEQIPHDFLAIYGLERSGTVEWKRSGLPLPYHAICLAIACRSQLESGGLTSTQAGPVVARLLYASAQAGFNSDDYPEASWGELMQAAPLQWQNFAKGTKALEFESPEALADAVEPGVGRMSITNAFACAVLGMIVFWLTVSSPFWLPRIKPFNDLFGPVARADAIATSIDLSSDGAGLAVATADQGLLSIDVRNYSVGSTGRMDGLSSNKLTDVIALSGRCFVVSTEGLYGSKGLDFVQDGKGFPIIGLPDEDHGTLTKDPPLTMVNIGGDALFVFARGLLHYDAARRVLIAVPGSPAEIIAACGSKDAQGRAWLLHMKDGKRTVCEVSRNHNGGFAFKDFTADPSVDPARIVHDGTALWCIDFTRSSVHFRQGDRWVLRAGSPDSAKENGGLASAAALAISRRSNSASSDVLWMIKSGKAFARTIPRDPLQAELPMPWFEVASIEEGYMGEVHAFTVDDVGHLIVPYTDRIELLSHHDSNPSCKRKLLLPREDARIRSVDVGSSDVVLATADPNRSQVYLIDQHDFVKLALDSVRAEWPPPLQSSAFLSSDFRLDDVVGAFKSDALTYHFDSAGRWLMHDASVHGLSNAGSELLPLEMSGEMLGKSEGLKVRSVSQSGDGTKCLVATNRGIYEMPLSSLGISGPRMRAIVPISPSMPGGASVPFGLSDTRSGPEVYFLETERDSQAEGSAPLASVWRLGNHLRFDSSWVRQLPGEGSGLIYSDSLVRTRIDRPDGGIRYGPPVALNEDRRLIFRDLKEDAWRLSALSGQWSSIVNVPEGGTVIRQLAGVKHDGDVIRISQLLPSQEGLQERRLWSPPKSVPKGALLSPEAVVPVAARGFIFPTEESFWAYRPMTRSWEKLMDRAPGNVTAFRVLSDEIRDASGASTIVWWSDDANNVYAASADRAAMFGRIGALAVGVATGKSYMTTNETNALFAFNLTDGSTRRIFAPINPEGERSEVSSIEDSEAGIAFLPVGGGKVLTLDDDDRFVQADGPSFSAIANVDSRLVGIADINGDSRLTGVFAAGSGVGSALNALHGLGGMAVMSSTTGDMWMGGFSGTVLRARIIGDSRPTDMPAGRAKVVAAASHDGQLFLSVDGGIHHRPDAPGAEVRPGFNRIGWGGADWFRSVGSLGKVAPSGGLGCYSLTGKLEFSLITKEPDSGFRIAGGLDVPVFGPGGGVYKLGSTGKVAPYDGTDGVAYGGASMLGSRSRVHPLGTGMLLLSRSSGAGIAYYDPSTGTDSAFGFVTAVDGKTMECPFGPDVDFIHASDSPGGRPFLRDGRTLGRLSSTFGNVEVLSEQAESPLVLAGRLRWLEGNRLLGALPQGSTSLSREELPSVSSSAKGVVKGLLHIRPDERLAMIVDGALVEIDLRRDKFVKHGAADVLFALPGGVVTAEASAGNAWVLADGTVPVPAALRDLGQVKLALSSAYLSAYKIDAVAGMFWIKGVAYSGVSDTIGFSLKVSPSRDLKLANGSTILQGRSLVHVEYGKIYRYDIDRGEWTEPELPVGFTASSIRRHNGGQYFVVDESAADLVGLGADGLPDGDVRRGAASGVSIEGALVGVKSLAPGRFSLNAGGKTIESEMDEWPRLSLAFSEQASTYSSNTGATLFFNADDSSKARLFVRKGDRLAESDVTFPKPLSGLSIHENPDGFIVTDNLTFIQGITVSADGDVSMSFDDFDSFPTGKLKARDVSPRGWVKIAGVHYHSSGYPSGRTPVPDVPVKMEKKELFVNVRRVSSDGASEDVIAVPLNCPRSSEMSLIHPDYRKPNTAESAPFVQGVLFADFNGQKIKLMDRNVASDRPAEVDDVGHLAVVGPTTLVQLDHQGGVWKRDLVSGMRTLMDRVSKQARLVYHRPLASGAVSVALEESGSVRLISADATLIPASAKDAEVTTSMDRFSLTIDRLQASSGPGGFSFKLASRFPLSVSSDGWIVDGANPAPVLRATTEGSLLLEFRSARAASTPLLRVPAEGERRILSGDLSADVSFLSDRVVTSAKIGDYAFDWSTGTLTVRHEGISRPLAIAPGGGIESDHYAQVAALIEDGRHHFICISKVSGRVFARSWMGDRLGSLSEVFLPGATVRPDLAVSVDVDTYIRAGADWYVLATKGGTIGATRLTGSPLRSWGEMRRASGATWAFENGNIMASSGSGWEEMPCRSAPVALACDLPSPLFEDYRALPSGGVVYKSRMSDGEKPIWYALGLDGGVPRRHEAALPARHVPPDSINGNDSLRNPMVFSRSKTTSYSLGLASTPNLQVGLQVQPGMRLPHLGEFTDAKAAGGAAYFRAGETLSQAQIYLRIPDDGGKTSLTLNLPARSEVTRHVGPAEWWINEGRVSLSWIPDKGLFLGIRKSGGQRSFVKVGSYASGKPFEIDDASQISLRSARLKSFSFSTRSSPEYVMVMPSEGHESLGETLSIHALSEVSIVGDVFNSPTAFSAEEMRPVNHETGAFIQDKFSCSLTKEGRIEVRPGFFIPLHRSSQLNGWVPPQGEAVAALRLADGGLLIQSCGGAWISFYAPNGELVSGRYADPADQSRLRWSGPSRTEAALVLPDSGRMLILPMLSDGMSIDPSEIHSVEAGLSLIRRGSGLFELQLAGVGIKSGCYPSVDFKEVSLYGDKLTLGDVYGVRTLESKVLSEVVKGGVKRRTFDEVTNAEPSDGAHACGAWKIVRRDGRFDALKSGESILDGRGVPFVDSIEGFDGYEKRLLFVHQTRLLVTESSVVTDAIHRGQGMLGGFASRDIRLALSDRDSRIGVDFGRHDVAAYDIQARSMVAGARPHRPAGIIFGTTAEFSTNHEGVFEMRIALRDGYQSPALVRYVGRDVIAYGQLASDRVLALKAHGDALYVQHAPSFDSPSGWYEKITVKGEVRLTPCREREGRCERIEVPGSYLRPWSETRNWGIREGKVFWEEAAARWGY